MSRSKCVHQGGGGGEEGARVESRLLGVVFVSRVKSSVSGEVEWLVPAYHVATGRQQGGKTEQKEAEQEIKL